MGSLSSPSPSPSSAPGATTPPQQLWLAAFVPPLDAFDALLVLRDEALPQAGRVLPAMANLLASFSAAHGSGGRCL